MQTVVDEAQARLGRTSFARDNRRAAGPRLRFAMFTGRQVVVSTPERPRLISR